uniref:Regulator of G-protein signaling 14-like n=1 Tax=Callorhinchus milii TaxID=7868 RepID=A0A4W3HMA1_CALMI|eukprot:gi/632975984/ref/XP_007904538.1/ PREDICTED: regulator of G-protein signaling 14-like [Callorhinchus milii]
MGSEQVEMGNQGEQENGGEGSQPKEVSHQSPTTHGLSWYCCCSRFALRKENEEDNSTQPAFEAGAIEDKLEAKTETQVVVTIETQAETVKDPDKVDIPELPDEVDIPVIPDKVDTPVIPDKVDTPVISDKVNTPMEAEMEPNVEATEPTKESFEFPAVSELVSWANSFDTLMKTRVGRNTFQEFLRTEHSEENMLFWLICEDFKKEKDMKVVEERAKTIYEAYVSTLSPREVSLDSHARLVVHKNLLKPSPQMFNEAQIQIYSLMHRDSFPRFLNSEMYKTLVQKRKPSIAATENPCPSLPEGEESGNMPFPQGEDPGNTSLPEGEELGSTSLTQGEEPENTK